MVIDRECRCRAYPWPHEFGLSDCGDRLARKQAADGVPERIAEQDLRYLDDQRTGQSDGLNRLARRHNTGEV